MDFIRVHRSYVVVMDKVTAYLATYLEVDRREIPIGRLFQRNVERALRV